MFLIDRIILQPMTTANSTLFGPKEKTQAWYYDISIVSRAHN